jgi:hypothetical protein
MILNMYEFLWTSREHTRLKAELNIIKKLTVNQ